MNLKKTVAIAAAAGALAAISVPAMAFENEFHGIYNLKFFVSNYENGGTAQIDPVGRTSNATTPAVFGLDSTGAIVLVTPAKAASVTYTGQEKRRSNNFFEQRARLQYIAKASDDLKLVTHFELDTKFGGDKSGKYGVSSDAGVLDADGIMLETKHVYLDFNLGKSVNVKTGVMPVKDSLKGVFLDADVAGILATSKISDATVAGGYFRFKTESSNFIAPLAATGGYANYNSNSSAIGHDNGDIFILDGKYAINKNLNVGASYYLLSDYSSATPTTIHTFGVNSDAKIGPVAVSGFFAAQTGYTYLDATGKGAGATGLDAATFKRRAASGYAANVAAKMAVGPGTLKTAGLFLTGDSDTANGNNTSWTTSTINTYAEGGMFLLFRTGVGGTTNDRTLSGGSFSNNYRGSILYTLGYDATITPKLYANTNVGMLWVAKSAKAPTNAVSGTPNGGDMLGTEINLEAGYKVYDNLTAKIQLAYVILGGAYTNTVLDAAGAPKTPEDPYTARIGLSYAF